MLLGGTATNMAYMLSVQLATMELNVGNHFVNPNAIIYATRNSERRFPIFTGGFAPDLRYFGFDIGVNEVAS